MTRIGKIARLPMEIRQQLNERLLNGEQGKRLVVWLNELPEVREVLAKSFGGKPISEQNLSQWKGGGYVEWRERRTLMEDLREETGAVDSTAGGTGQVTDHLATAVSVRFVEAMGNWTEGEDLKKSRDFQVLRTLLMDISTLRRGDHSAARLKLGRELADLQREKREADFLRWLGKKNVRELLAEEKEPTTDPTESE